jgi:lipopolysaccharide heptosyltransferase I
VRVLIVKTSSLGDVIHTLPALTDAAKARPGIKFDWVVEEAFAEIPAWHPAVENVIPTAVRRWRKTPFDPQTRRQWRTFKKTLRRQHYDAVIDAQGLIKSALIARLVKAPLYGMDADSVRERIAAYSYQHPLAVPREMHAVERTRMLFSKALHYRLPSGTGNYGVRENLKAGNRELPPSLLFFHGTARAEKLWPESHWLELAARAGANGYKVWMPWGSEEEKARARRLAQQDANIEVLPRLSLVGLASMLLEVDGAVAVDTGLGHLSAALDVPTVSLYGPTKVSLIGAYGANQVHIQSALSKSDHSSAEDMMVAIEPAQVWQELESILPGELAS